MDGTLNVEISSTPSLNLSSDGHLIAEVRLSGSGVSNDSDEGIVFVGRDRNPTLFLRKGTEVETPAPAGSSFIRPSSLFVDANGRFAFRGILAVPNESNGTAAFLGSVDDFSENVIPLFSIAEVFNTGALTDVYSTILTDSGRFAFSGAVVIDQAPFTQTAIWSDNSSGSNPTMAIISEGERYEGMPANSFISSLQLEFQINRANELLVGASQVWNPDTQSEVTVHSLLLMDLNSRVVSLIVKDGDSAPGLQGITIDPAIAGLGRENLLSENGWIAYEATLEGPGINSDNDEALLVSQRGDSKWLVAREGDEAPGAGGTFGRFFFMEGITPDGVVLFENRINLAEGGSAQSLWSWNNETLKLIAIDGQNAPGLGELSISGVLDGAISREGRIAFQTRLSDLSTVIFLTDSNGDNPAYLIGKDNVMPTPEGGSINIRTVRLVDTRFGEDFDEQGRILVELTPQTGGYALVLLDPDKPLPGISGKVFNDIDYDGSISPADVEIPEVVVKLYAGSGDGSTSGPPLQSVNTATNGSYFFEDVAPGQYVIVLVSPEEFRPVLDSTEPIDDGRIEVVYVTDAIEDEKNFLLAKQIDFDVTTSLHKLHLQAISQESLTAGNTNIDAPLEVTDDSLLLSQLPKVAHGLAADGVTPLIIKLAGPEKALPQNQDLRVFVSEVDGSTRDLTEFESKFRVLVGTQWMPISETFVMPKDNPETVVNEAINWLQLLPFHMEDLSLEADATELLVTIGIMDMNEEKVVGGQEIYIRKPPVFLFPSFNSTGNDWGSAFLEVLKISRPDFVVPVPYATESKTGVPDNTVRSLFSLARILQREIKIQVQDSLRTDWAFTRPDVIGFGQGGVLARMLSSVDPTNARGMGGDPVRPFQSEENFFRGRFGKIITVAAPHNGSRYHYYMRLMRPKITKIRVVDYDAIYETVFGTSNTVKMAKWDPLEPDGQIELLNEPEGHWKPNEKAKFHLVSPSIYGGQASGTLDEFSNKLMLRSALVFTNADKVLPNGFDGVVDVDSMEGHLPELPVPGNVSRPSSIDLSHFDNRELFELKVEDPLRPGEDRIQPIEVQARSAYLARFLLDLLDGPIIQGEQNIFDKFPWPLRYPEGAMEEIRAYIGGKKTLDSASLSNTTPQSKFIPTGRFNDQVQQSDASGVYELTFTPAEEDPLPDSGIVSWSAYLYGEQGIESIGEALVPHENDPTKASLTVPDGVPGDYWLTAMYVAENESLVFAPSMLVVSVKPPDTEPVEIVIEPDPGILEIGEAVQPKIFVKYGDGTMLRKAFLSVEFESSDSQVLDVSTDGGWLAVSEGSSLITATISGLSSSTNWIVQNPAQIGDVIWEDWRGAFFAGADLSDLGVSGPDADPDGDEASNLIEYIRASDPCRSDDFNTVAVDTVREGDLYFAHVRFPVRDLLENISVTIQRSNGLDQWEDIFVATEPGVLESDMIVDADYGEAVSVFTLRDEEPLSNPDEERFYRLVAEVVEL